MQHQVFQLYISRLNPCKALNASPTSDHHHTPQHPGAISRPNSSRLFTDLSLFYSSLDDTWISASHSEEHLSRPPSPKGHRHALKMVAAAPHNARVRLQSAALAPCGGGGWGQQGGCRGGDMTQLLWLQQAGFKGFQSGRTPVVTGCSLKPVTVGFTSHLGSL